MATTIIELFTQIGQNTEQLRTTKWGQPLNCSEIGIYIVSTNSDPNSNFNLFEKAPIDNNALINWIKKVPSIEIDNKPATIEILRMRLDSFWLPDESIIYIGQTKGQKGLNGRVRQYYNTALGDSKPHAGGHWIKTLENLKELYVHYLPVLNPIEIEKKLLLAFSNQVSELTKKNLFDPKLPLPFANLEIDASNRKKHHIGKSTLK